jgi:hypothetical protein
MLISQTKKMFRHKASTFSRKSGKIKILKIYRGPITYKARMGVEINAFCNSFFFITA